MTYDSFINQRNPFNNLYVIVRKSDGKDILRGCNYNSAINTIELVGKENVLIYFY